jgi:hypothetical protein
MAQLDAGCSDAQVGVAAQRMTVGIDSAATLVVRRDRSGEGESGEKEAKKKDPQKNEHDNVPFWQNGYRAACPMPSTHKRSVAQTDICGETVIYLCMAISYLSGHLTQALPMTSNALFWRFHTQLDIGIEQQASGDLPFEFFSAAD